MTCEVGLILAEKKTTNRNFCLNVTLAYFITNFVGHIKLLMTSSSSVDRKHHFLPAGQGLMITLLNLFKCDQKRSFFSFKILSDLRILSKNVPNIRHEVS